MRTHLFRALTAIAVLGFAAGSAFAQTTIERIPTLSEWGLIALGSGLAALGVRMIGKRNRSQDK